VSRRIPRPPWRLHCALRANRTLRPQEDHQGAGLALQRALARPDHPPQRSRCDWGFAGAAGLLVGGGGPASVASTAMRRTGPGSIGLTCGRASAEEHHRALAHCRRLRDLARSEQQQIGGRWRSPQDRCRETPQALGGALVVGNCRPALSSSVVFVGLSGCRLGGSPLGIVVRAVF